LDRAVFFLNQSTGLFVRQLKSWIRYFVVSVTHCVNCYCSVLFSLITQMRLIFVN